ncbi:MAG: hypothetical protein R3C68_05340 [Myxococcota bacterium]
MAFVEALAEANQELARAEGVLKQAQQRRASDDVLAAGFRRMEIALGHLLDVWAIARQSGFDLTTPRADATVSIHVPAQFVQHTFKQLR